MIPQPMPPENRLADVVQLLNDARLIVMLLDENGLICSMSRRANCWDNAVAESFFGTLKVELVGDRTFRSRMEARQAVFKYIEAFYNSRRLHSSLGYRSPAEFEKLYWAA